MNAAHLRRICGAYLLAGTLVLELKILRKELEQTVEYLERMGAPEAHLAIFDRDPGRPWPEKIWRRVEEHKGRKIVVWGM